MSSLRRDLLERRMWLVAALLLAAIIAVPLLLLKSAPADGTPTPLPPAVTVKATPPVSAAKTVPVKVLIASIPRNPFAGGMPKLSAKPAAHPSATASASSSATSTTAAMVSPAPAAPSTSSTSSTTAGSTSATAPTTSTTSTTTTPTTTTSATTTSTTPPATPAVARSWTMYSVWLRFGKDTSVPVQTNVARLTPLPSVKQPEVMFTGVMAGGRQAVFALAAGVRHQGPGLCRPDRTRCSAITLEAGQTEVITITTAHGGHQRRVLRLVHIASSVTHSQSVALAAYDRHSAAGLCELELAAPVSYSQAKGTLTRVTGVACQNQPAAVPFPYAVPGA
jgi:hypothetical protein